VATPRVVYIYIVMMHSTRWISHLISVKTRLCLVLRPLSCGSCSVYIISIATDDVTKRVIYTHGTMLDMGVPWKTIH